MRNLSSRFFIELIYKLLGSLSFKAGFQELASFSMLILIKDPLEAKLYNFQIGY
jgi:hypothetical protein